MNIQLPFSAISDIGVGTECDTIYDLLGVADQYQIATAKLTVLGKELHDELNKLHMVLSVDDVTHLEPSVEGFNVSISPAKLSGSILTTIINTIIAICKKMLQIIKDFYRWLMDTNRRQQKQLIQIRTKGILSNPDAVDAEAFSELPASLPVKADFNNKLMLLQDLIRVISSIAVSTDPHTDARQYLPILNEFGYSMEEGELVKADSRDVAIPMGALNYSVIDVVNIADRLIEALGNNRELQSIHDKTERLLKDTLKLCDQLAKDIHKEDETLTARVQNVEAAKDKSKLLNNLIRAYSKEIGILASHIINVTSRMIQKKG